MATTTLEFDLDAFTAALDRGPAEASVVPAQGAAEPDVDPDADCVRVWCTEARGPVLLFRGFCECCGARDHDCA